MLLQIAQVKQIEFVFAASDQQHEYAKQFGVEQLFRTIDDLLTVYHLNVQEGVGAELP